MKQVTIGALTLSNDLPLAVIAGPCQLESLDHARMIAEAMARACADAGAQFIFKASYDKANRTSLSGKRGLGIAHGLEIGRAAVRNYMPMQAGDVPATWADASLLSALTGYRPQTPFRDGVAAFVRWYRDYYRV